jgi:type IV pilus assembly protein PilE
MMANTQLRVPPRVRGFTVIELMIAVVVVGLIMSLAFPSFMGSIRKSRRAEAFAALSAVQLKQERWRANNSGYSGDLTSDWPTGLQLPAATPGGYYAIAIAGNSATGYEITATPSTGSSQTQDGACAKLGVKMVAGNLFYGSASSTDVLAYSASNGCWSH